RPPRRGAARGGEARHQPVHEARPPAGHRRPPQGARRAALARPERILAMTHPDAAPAVQDASPPPPGRGSTARALTTLGVLLGAAVVVTGALFLADLMMSATSTTHRSYDAVGTVELVADGDVTVTAAEGDVEVDAVARSGLREPRYAADEGGDRLEITHRCDWSVFLPRCSGGLDVTLPAGTEVVVRTENGDVVASGVAGSVE